MKNTSDIVGMLAFPFQTEIAFVVAIFTTAQRLVVSARVSVRGLQPSAES